MKFIKAIVFVLILYIYFYQAAFPPVRNFILLLFLLLDISLILYWRKLPINKRKLPVESRNLFILYGIIFLPGLYMTSNASFYINQFFAGLHYVVLFYAVFLTIRESGKFDYIIIGIIVTSVAYALTIYFFGVEVGRQNRLALSDKNNPNSAAFILMLGVMVLVLFSYKGKFYQVVLVLFIVFVSPLLLKTGSRKAFLALFLFAMLIIWFNYVIKLRLNKPLITFKFLIVVIGLIIGGYLLQHSFANSIMYDRINELEYDGGDQTRFEMYKEAFELFMEYPIFGVGYWNFAKYSGRGTYSHSTYAEVIACTGLVGTVLWFGVYYMVLKKIIRALNRNKNSQINNTLNFFISLFIVLLFYATGTVQLYEPLFYILLGTMLGYTSFINNQNLIKSNKTR